MIASFSPPVLVALDVTGPARSVPRLSQQRRTLRSSAARPDSAIAVAQSAQRATSARDLSLLVTCGGGTKGPGIDRTRGRVGYAATPAAGRLPESWPDPCLDRAAGAGIWRARFVPAWQCRCLPMQ